MVLLSERVVPVLGRDPDVRLEVHGSAGSSAAGPEDVTGPTHTFLIDRFAEACTVSWQEHRPVRVSEVRSTA